MAALPNLMTVAEFRTLPESGEFTYELHHGEVVAVTRPKMRHWGLQSRLHELLLPKIKPYGLIATEMPYRPVAEFEFRVADVGVVSWARWNAGDPDGDLFGAPELVIEVKSPSNTWKQLQELISLCLANGALQCWVVEPLNKSVTVIQRDGRKVTYGPGEEVPLAAFGSDSLAVDQIFAE